MASHSHAGKQPRKTILSLGRKGKPDYVRVLVDEKQARVEVKYKDAQGVSRKRIWPSDRQGRKEAQDWARAFHEERVVRGTARPETTHAELWRQYVESPAYDALRDDTKTAYTERWRSWMVFRGATTRPDDTTLLHVDQYYAKARAAGKALNQIRQVIGVARIIYNWGQSRKLLTNNELALYRWRTPKDVEETEPGEYTAAELERMIATLNPQRHDQWRPWVALTLLAHHGMRANALLHLRWADVDWARGVIVWPGRYQKQGKDVEQPMLWPTVAALLTARYWRARETVVRTGARVRGADGVYRHDPAVPDQVIDTPWVLFALNVKTNAYSYTSLHYQLTKAETAAGITHEKYRALHGGRRTVVGNVIEATGDRMLGLEYVGDTDPKQLKHYDKRRTARIAQAAAALEERERIPERSAKARGGNVPEVSPAPENDEAPHRAGRQLTEES